MLWSWLDVARVRPSGEKATAQTVSACVLERHSSRPLPTSHNLAVWSIVSRCQPAAIRRKGDRRYFVSVGKLPNLGATRSIPEAGRLIPARAYQITSIRRKLDREDSPTWPLASSRRDSVPRERSQTCAIPLPDAVPMKRPSAENVAALSAEP
jgi:hypothetical protein